jgi:Domain of unknown function (DUF4271)
MYANNVLSVQQMKDKIHFTHYDYIPAIVLFFMLCLFVWVLHTNKKKVGQIIKGFYSNRYSNQLAREDVSIGNRVTVFLFLLFACTVSLFLSLLSQYLGFIFFENPYLNWAVVLAGVLLVYLFKIGIVTFFGNVFLQKKIASDYKFVLLLFCSTMGLFMFPLVVLLQFAKTIPIQFLYYLGVFVLLGFIIIRLMRGLFLGLNAQRVSVVYLFFYLCALEIMPFFLFYKILKVYL